MPQLEGLPGHGPIVAAHPHKAAILEPTVFGPRRCWLIGKLTLWTMCQTSLRVEKSRSLVETQKSILFILFVVILPKDIRQDSFGFPQRLCMAKMKLHVSLVHGGKTKRLKTTARLFIG